MYMKNTKKIFGSLLLLTLLVPVLSFAKDGERLENRGPKIDAKLERASTTTMRFENRENNIEKIRTRLASTTASTTEKRMERLNDRLEKQREQMGKAKERLLNRETKIIETLTKIADKIATRIDILEGKNLDMTAASAKLDEANAKLVDLTAEADVLSALVATEVTEANKDQLFTDIRTAQDKIRTLARETHALLVDTVKEITKVLPQRPATTTTTN
jgi:chromosome segregation ATPase